MISTPHPWLGWLSFLAAISLAILSGSAAAPEQIHVKDGFKVELLYSVPKATQGSWIAMCVDGEGRLIVSSQYGDLFRLPVPAPGEVVDPASVERIDLEIGRAQGLTWANDSLYVVVNGEVADGPGLYRLRDLAGGDGKLDSVELLRKFDAQIGEHGPHAVISGPDGKSLYLMFGNGTQITGIDQFTAPRVWADDLLLRQPARAELIPPETAPAGWVAKTDPDGRHWELIATGLRNAYDIAFNRDGELFTFDSDEEPDMSTPWYRPTRICHIVSGSEFGWRGYGGKWPPYYFDSCPPVVEIGPGSPTGIVFGYDARLPPKYQNALFACDWSHGKLYAVHLKPDGASYGGEFEEILSAQPLPLTDIVTHPEGAIYFTTGGRKIQSGLYRLTWEGEPGETIDIPKQNEISALRKSLEKLHTRSAPGAVDTVWPHLNHEDRFVRQAARLALEHQPVETWGERALTEPQARPAIEALLALTRQAERSEANKTAILTALDAIASDPLSLTERLDLARVQSVALSRLGAPEPGVTSSLAKFWTAQLPLSGEPELTAEVLQLLVFLQAPEAAALGMDRIQNAANPEEKLNYAKSLRHLRAGWTPELRTRFFEWFNEARSYRGGGGLPFLLGGMRHDAIELAPDDERERLGYLIDAPPAAAGPAIAAKQRDFVANWTVAAFDEDLKTGLAGGRSYAKGRVLFAEGGCFGCHRFNGEGGALGPDLTHLAGRFSPRDLLEHTLDPNLEISDQYGSIIVTKTDGSKVIGEVVNLTENEVIVGTNMLDPNERAEIPRSEIDSIEPSPISLMPPGLLNHFTKVEVLDLLAYLLSRGDLDNPMFH